MSFRNIPDPHIKHTTSSTIGLVGLDEDFNPSGPPQILDLRFEHPSIPCRAEDARLIQVGGELAIVYSDNTEPTVSKGGYRVYLAYLQEREGVFFTEHYECLSDFEGASRAVREKNWVPFVYKDELLLAYSIEPHRIVKPLTGTGTCLSLSSNEKHLNWPWGVIRGGTPGLVVGNHYLSFFHSVVTMPSLHSQNKSMPHYFIGAYLFSLSPPFELCKISKSPIVGAGFYSGKNYPKRWGSNRVVFPGGYLIDDNMIWLFYGRQDYEIWAAKIDKQALLDSLEEL